MLYSLLQRPRDVLYNCAHNSCTQFIFSCGKKNLEILKTSTAVFLLVWWSFLKEFLMRISCKQVACRDNDNCPAWSLLSCFSFNACVRARVRVWACVCRSMRACACVCVRVHDRVHAWVCACVHQLQFPVACHMGKWNTIDYSKEKQHNIVSVDNNITTATTTTTTTGINTARRMKTIIKTTTRT